MTPSRVHWFCLKTHKRGPMNPIKTSREKYSDLQSLLIYTGGGNRNPMPSRIYAKTTVENNVALVNCSE